MQSDNEKTMRRYLLGEVSDDERQQIERRLLTDRDFVEQVSLLEEELVDEYVRGDLPSGEQEEFERYFMSTPEGVGQIRLATILKRYASTVTMADPEETAVEGVVIERHGFAKYLRSRASLPGYALAAAAVLIVLIGCGLVAGIVRLQSERDRLRSQVTAAGAEELQKQLAEQEALNARIAEQLKLERDRLAKIEQELIALKGSKGSDQQIRQLPLEGRSVAGMLSLSAAPIILTPGIVRSEGEIKQLVIKPGIERALFHLLVREADYIAYRVSLQSEDGKEVWTADALKVESIKRRKVVRVNPPASLLSNGIYFLKLQGATAQGDYEDAGRYYFKVARK